MRLLDLVTDYYIVFRNLTFIPVSCQLDNLNTDVLSVSQQKFLDHLDIYATFIQGLAKLNYPETYSYLEQ